MKNNRIIIVLACLLLGSLGARGQYNETNHLLYHAQRSPQSNIMNPAFFPANSTFYISLPNLEVKLGSPLAINDMMHYDQQAGQTIIDVNSIFDQLSDENKMRVGANIDILGFGFKVKHTFYTFNLRLVNAINVGMPISTFDALQNGNIDANGNAIDEIAMLRGDLVDIQSYLEAGIGMGYLIEPLNLTVGLRAKLLYGIANIQSENTHVTLHSNAALDEVTARMYYEIQAATFVPYDTVKGQFDFGNIGNMVNPFEANTGLAFDLGAKYDWGPFTFSLAINDLSAGIHWKKNVSTWRPENGQGYIEFSGLDVNTLLHGGSLNTDSISNYLQERIDAMKPTRVDSGDYWYSIPTKINLGASYNFAKMLRAGLLFHGQFDRGIFCKRNDNRYGLAADVENTFRFNTTLSLSANLWNWAEVIVGNSLVYDGSSLDVLNPGVGIILTPFTVFQLHIMADYISSFYLAEAKSFNVKFGINLLFGRGGSKKITEG